MSQEDRTRWDGRHATVGPAAVDEVGLPAVFRPFATAFPTVGHALDLACGRGTASVWLARRGLDTVGVDISPVAVATATALAAAAGVADSCHFDVVDLDRGLPLGRPADVVICHRFRDPRLDQAIIDRLAPRAVLAVSALSEVGAQPGPFRAKAGELTRAFAGLNVIEADEGGGHAWLLAHR